MATTVLIISVLTSYRTFSSCYVPTTSVQVFCEATAACQPCHMDNLTSKYSNKEAKFGLWDLALNKQTSQSSRNPTNPSNYGNDNNKATYALATGRRSAWWAVDLGEVSRIDRVLSYLDSGSYNKRFNIETSTDGSRWRTCGDKVTLRRGASAGMVSQVMRCTGDGKEGRYLRISTKAPYWTREATLALYDIKVYGNKRSMTEMAPPETGTLDQDIEVKANAPSKVEGVSAQKDEGDALGVKECAKKDLRACSNYPKSRYYCSQTWMSANCPNKCGLCRYADAPPRTRAAAPPALVMRRAAGGQLPACKKDNNRQCYTYKDKNYYCRQRWMQLNCKEYCGYCKFPQVTYPKAPPPSILDDVKPVCVGYEHQLCGYFLKTKKNKEYYCKQTWTRKNCKFSCGICKHALAY